MLCVSNRDAAMFATQRRGLSLEASWDWDLGQRQVWVSRTCSRKASYLSFNYTILHKPGVDSENAMKKMAQPQDHQPISTYIKLYQPPILSHVFHMFPPMEFVHPPSGPSVAAPWPGPSPPVAGLKRFGEIRQNGLIPTYIMYIPIYRYRYRYRQYIKLYMCIICTYIYTCTDPETGFWDM